MTTHQLTIVKRRRFFMIMPFLIIPFITMLFWILGGGTGASADAKPTPHSGINMTLPEAQFDNREAWDKLSLYEQAESDSVKFRHARENDPYFDLVAFKTTHASETNQDHNNLIQNFPQKKKNVLDQNEEKVNSRLSELYREINKASLPQPVPKDHLKSVSSSDPQFTEDVDRLEKLMSMMNQSDPGADPEMQQIEGVLDKILDIQHPERVKTRKTNQYASILPSIVRGDMEQKIVTDLNNINAIRLDEDSSALSSRFLFSSNGFYGLEELTSVTEAGNAIEAVVHETQELVAGATVRLRLSQDITVNGVHIPKDELVHGICSVNGERLTIEINSIRFNNSIVPVSLHAFDLDGLEGIYIPGAITRDAAKKASGDALQSMQMMSLNQSLEAQATGAGIEAVKGLFTKKARLTKVTVKSGYKILLVGAQTHA